MVHKFIASHTYTLGGGAEWERENGRERHTDERPGKLFGILG